MTQERAPIVSDSEIEVIRATLNPDLNDAELRLFATVAAHHQLDPFAGQIYAVKRRNRRTGVERVVFQTSIDGYRSIAARTGEYDGQDEPEYGPECGCGGAPPRHPTFAIVRVYRKGVGRSIAGRADWHETKPATDDFMWQDKPRLMLAKCAEAQALRKAFPYDPTRQQGIGNDVYTPEELGPGDDDSEGAPAPTTGRELVAMRAAAARAALTENEALGAVAAPLDEAAAPDTGLYVSPSMSTEEFVLWAKDAGAHKAAIADALEAMNITVGDAKVSAVVAGMTGEERGELAARLGR